MSWVYVVIAGLLEIVWAYLLKRSDGFSRPLESVACLAAMAVSFWLLSLAMKALPMGSAYAVWTGIGAAGAFLVGVIALSEPANVLRIGSVTLIVLGIIGLRLAKA